MTIPNSKLASEALINFSRMTQGRIHWSIGLEYWTTKEHIRDIVRDILTYIHSHEDFETDPTKTKTFVCMDSFGPSSIDIMVYCSTKTTQWGGMAGRERTTGKKSKILWMDMEPVMLSLRLLSM